jgi:acyl-CoA oxidase
LAADGLEDCRRACGGHGYLLTSGVAAIGADYVWQVTAEGDFVVMQLQTARYLMKSLETARKGGALSGLTECLTPLSNPQFDLKSAAPQPPKTWEGFLRLDYLESLFRYRTMVAIVDAGNRLRDHQKAGQSFDDAWNACAMTLRRTAVSHCYYFLVSKFIATIKDVPDEACKVVLTRLCALFATSNIVDGVQWTGLVGGREVNLADQATTELLQLLRPDAVALVDAFDIPDRVLNSALGRYDGNVYEDLYVSARKSVLNHKHPFQGYEQYLRPHLDLKFLALRNRKIPDNFEDLTPSEVSKLAVGGMKAKL